ncbi:putative reverse transcriptase domain-containing protein [Tanacetum coccineum]
MPTSRQGLSAATIDHLITQRVAEAIAAYEENQNNQNGNGNPNVNVGGVVRIARECTYQDFMKCQPLNFKGTEADNALTWWNSHKRIIGIDAAFVMTWKVLMKLMTKVYCPRNEIQKMETELWNLAVKGNLIAAEPTRLQDAIRVANSLMDQKLKGYAAKDAKNKWRLDNNQRDNRVQQLPLKRCGNFKKVGHQASWASITMTCYGCGGKGHTKRYCLELGNKNGDGEAR